MKRFLLAFMVLFLLTAYVTAAEFWASKKSDKYHEPTCKLAQKIKEDNLIKFESPKQAAEAGYVPCKRCNPPLANDLEG